MNGIMVCQACLRQARIWTRGNARVACARPPAPLTLSLYEARAAGFGWTAQAPARRPATLPTTRRRRRRV